MEQSDLLKFVIARLDALGIRYMVVGSYGSGAWGELRFTHDIDIVVALQAADVPHLAAAFPAEEFYLSIEAALSAVEHRSQFNLIHPTSGNKVDFIIEGTDAWGRSQLARRRCIELTPGLNAYVGAPEDIIIGKMLYYNEGGSEKHLRDITGILKVSGQDVDLTAVEAWAKQLGLDEIWQAIRRRTGQP